MMSSTKGKKDASKRDHRRTSTGNSTTPRITKEMVSFIEHEELVEKKPNQKKENKTAEGGVARVSCRTLLAIA